MNATRNDEMILEDEAFLNISETKNHSNIEDDNELIECFLNLPTMEELPNPISLHMNHQQQDPALMDLARSALTKFPVRIVSNVPLITHVRKHPDDWKIFILNSLINDIIRWYHETLGHCGSQKLYGMIRSAAGFIVRISLPSVEIINVPKTVSNINNSSNNIVIFLLGMQW